VTNTNRIAMVATLVPAPAVARTEIDRGGKVVTARQEPAPYAVRREVLLSPLKLPCNPPPWGSLHAVDTATGEVRWEVPLGTLRDLAPVPTPRRWGAVNLGGSLVTGGLVFIAATPDRRIRAFDLATGVRRWESALPASAQATPMTYRARAGGRQYLVIAAGGHDGMGSRHGDFIVAYALAGSDP
jgi:quinoprotein glucose dehydrogenase